MTSSSHAIPASWVEYAESHLDDSQVEHPTEIREARSRAADLGLSSVCHQGAAFIELMTATIGAQAVIEVGTGVGITGAAILAGMTPGGVLTSIDLESEYQRNAKELFDSLGNENVRTRLIAGRALEVLPRFSDGAYDLVVVDSDPGEYPAITAEAKRLLRIGGMVIFLGVFATGISDQSIREYEAVAMRDTVAELNNDDDWLTSLLTVGDGILVASLRSRG